MNLLKYLKNPLMIFVKLDRLNIIKLSDEKYIKIIYRYRMGKSLNIKNPITFNEKLQWLKLYDRKDIYTTMVDKFEVKKYVENIIGKKYIIPTIGIYNTFDEINFNELPNQFVIKCTHDSGGLVICKDKEKLDIDYAKRKIEKSMQNDYYKHCREWPYKNIKPRIIIEKYMGDNLNDYKLFCFDGEVKFTLVCSNRNGNSKNTDFYDNEWNLLPFTRECHLNNPNGIRKPVNFNEMIQISKLLSKHMPFIRVDLYEINGNVFFGELTFYPSGGFEGFSPKEWDKKIGDMLKI